MNPTCVDFFSCRLGLTLRKPLAARDELPASPFLRPSVTLRDRQESEEKVNHFIITKRGFLQCVIAPLLKCNVRILHLNSQNSAVTYPSLMSENHSLKERGRKEQ